MGHLIEVGGFDGVGAEAAKIVVALVVGEDDDDVFEGGCSAEESAGEKEKKSHVGSFAVEELFTREEVEVVKVFW